MTSVYVALPYSHPEHEIREYRYKTAQHYLQHLAEQGIVSMSPVVMCHAIVGTNIPYQYWVDLSIHMLKSCTELHVLMLPNWTESKGVTIEIEYAQQNGIPIKYIEEVKYDN